jgi:hypothetical protein
LKVAKLLYLLRAAFLSSSLTDYVALDYFTKIFDWREAQNMV